MIVVSDASPVCYLAVLGHLEVLPQLFGVVAIPRVVELELLAPSAPTAVRKFIEQPPKWLQVHDEPAELIGLMATIDAGERAAILLAERLKAKVILLDDLDARYVAQQRGLVVTGLIGILGRAAHQGFLDYDAAIARLGITNFRISASIVEAVRKEFELP